MTYSARGCFERLLRQYAAEAAVREHMHNACSNHYSRAHKLLYVPSVIMGAVLTSVIASSDGAGADVRLSPGFKAATTILSAGVTVTTTLLGVFKHDALAGHHHRVGAAYARFRVDIEAILVEQGTISMMQQAPVRPQSTHTETEDISSSGDAGSIESPNSPTGRRRRRRGRQNRNLVHPQREAATSIVSAPVAAAPAASSAIAASSWREALSRVIHAYGNLKTDAPVVPQHIMVRFEERLLEVSVAGGVL